MFGFGSKKKIKQLCCKCKSEIPNLKATLKYFDIMCAECVDEDKSREYSQYMEAIKDLPIEERLQMVEYVLFNIEYRERLMAGMTKKKKK